ncbi:MAG: Lon protease [Alphaproteobacteria bacterium MarineAlpha9_Bin2]|nr:MAG: Lon protease [Alphaproteobacteria bacterium MarineAlpha9_Bin2]
MDSQLKLKVLPLIPLRDIVVYPSMVAPLFVGRNKSVSALELAMNGNKRVVLLTQKKPEDDDPEFKDLYNIGTVGTILQLLKLPDGTVKALVEGIKRVKVDKIIEEAGHYKAFAEELPDSDKDDKIELTALLRSVSEQFNTYVKLNKKISTDIISSINEIEEASKLADTISSHLNIKVADKQKLLEEVSVATRLEKILGIIESELDVMKVEKKIRSRVKNQMEKTQKEYYLNEQMKAIQKELTNGEDKDELVEYEEKINNTKFSKEALDRAKSELRKLKSMGPTSAESTVVRNYLDWLLELPWKKNTKIKRDINEAEEILNEDHYGLHKVKERILEYLAVQHRAKKIKGPIICLVGAPGVGKTSLGKSLARATGRNFVRMSLGGIRDESEIRGHRRTYIGSMPGKIIQGIKKSKSSNPLFLLDEIDKIGADWRGDPASALLEVLDPEQNTTFNDHYLDLDYDLSNVLFVTTANTLKMPKPLLDRMEIINLSGYLENEKLEIAKRHLINKQKERNGLKDNEWSIADRAVIDLIRYYTREAGVRGLEREIASLCRKAIKKIVSGKLKNIKITSKNLASYAGVRKYRHGLADKDNLIGVTTGLAYTDFGGDLLSIEAVVMNGKGRQQITGQLGDVMIESVRAATSYVRSRATQFGIEPPFFEKKDIHVHVPEGATPKDGPSAGVAIAITMISVLTGIAVKSDVAVTGEISLRGRVLPVGGLKEKLLAAVRGGIKKVLIPDENARDLKEVPTEITKNIEIVLIKHLDDAISQALIELPIPIDWTEKDFIAGRTSKDNVEGVVKH